MRKITFFLFGFFILLLSPMLSSIFAQSPTDYWAKATVLYFPHFAVGGGTEYRDGSRLLNGYEFGIIFRGIAPVDDLESSAVRLTWYTTEGKRTDLNVEIVPGMLSEGGGMNHSLFSGTASQVTFSLPSPEIKTGWIKAEVLPTSSSLLPAEVRLQFRYKVNGFVVGQATVEPMMPATNLVFYAKRYSSPKQDPTDTGVALANPNQAPANISILLKNRLGSVFSIANETLPAMSQKSFFLSQRRALAGIADFEGSVEIKSDIGIIGLALQTTGDVEHFNFSTINVVGSNGSKQ